MAEREHKLSGVFSYGVLISSWGPHPYKPHLILIISQRPPSPNAIALGWESLQHLLSLHLQSLVAFLLSLSLVSYAYSPRIHSQLKYLHAAFLSVLLWGNLGQHRRDVDQINMQLERTHMWRVYILHINVLTWLQKIFWKAMWSYYWSSSPSLKGHGRNLRKWCSSWDLKKALRLLRQVKGKSRQRAQYVQRPWGQK